MLKSQGNKGSEDSYQATLQLSVHDHLDPNTLSNSNKKLYFNDRKNSFNERKDHQKA